MPPYKTYNDLVHAIAKEVRALADDPIRELRASAGGYGSNSRAEAIRAAKHMGRGECIQVIIDEEFVLTDDLGFEE